MLYEFDNIVLTSHNVNNKLKNVYTLSQGIIHHIDICFPLGCAGIIHTTLSKGLYQIFPSNASGNTKGDGIIVSGDTFTSLFNEPYEIVFNGWGVEADYIHTITVRLWVKRLWQLMPFSDQMYKLSNEHDVSEGI